MSNGQKKLKRLTLLDLPLISDFLTRNNLTTQDLEACDDFLARNYAGKAITPVGTQGFCSLTFTVGEDLIIQFRPPRYRQDLAITSLASQLYPSHAPTTKYIGTVEGERLLIYEMSRVPGVSLQSFRLEHPQLSQDASVLKRLAKDLAEFQITSFKSSSQDLHTRFKMGRVGATIQERLLMLHRHLPLRFRPVTTNLLANLEAIISLPWVLTHGDLLPGNIMLSPVTGILSGLVDWAEAEFLPFGISFYGVDETLSQLSEDGKECKYHRHVDELRRIFWVTLEDGLEELKDGKMRRSVQMARDLGVVLWYGIAFDGGKIDRVVQEGIDMAEIAKLDAFLDTKQIEIGTGRDCLAGLYVTLESKL